METNLSKDTSKLLFLMYQAYLTRRENGQDKAQARMIGNSDYIKETFVHDWSENDVKDTCIELKKAGFILYSVTTRVELTKDSVTYMESRFGDNLSKIADFLKDIPIIGKILY